MKFHLDENVTAAVGRGLRERGINVTVTSPSGLLGAADLLQFQFAAAEERVLVSHDTDMLRLASEAIASGSPFAGVAYCEKRKYATGQLIGRLLALAAKVDEAEMRNSIEFL